MQIFVHSERLYVITHLRKEILPQRVKYSLRMSIWIYFIRLDVWDLHFLFYWYRRHRNKNGKDPFWSHVEFYCYLEYMVMWKGEGMTIMFTTFISVQNMAHYFINSYDLYLESLVSVVVRPPFEIFEEELSWMKL